MNQKSELRAEREKEARVEQHKIFQGRIVSLIQEHIHYSNGEEKVYDLVDHPGAVILIPIDRDEKLIFVKQWRQAARQILLELPAGTIEKKEPLDCCAQRELREETGFEAKSLTLLGSFFTTPGFCTEKIFIFLAENLSYHPLIGDDSEEIDTISLCLSEALQWVDEGKIIDAKTMVALYKYQRIKKL